MINQITITNSYRNYNKLNHKSNRVDYTLIIKEIAQTLISFPNLFKFPKMVFNRGEILISKINNSSNKTLVACQKL